MLATSTIHRTGRCASHESGAAATGGSTRIAPRAVIGCTTGAAGACALAGVARTAAASAATPVAAGWEGAVLSARPGDAPALLRGAAGATLELDGAELGASDAAGAGVLDGGVPLDDPLDPLPGDPGVEHPSPFLLPLPWPLPCPFPFPWPFDGQPFAVDALPLVLLCVDDCAATLNGAMTARPTATTTSADTMLHLDHAACRRLTPCGIFTLLVAARGVNHRGSAAEKHFPDARRPRLFSS